MSTIEEQIRSALSSFWGERALPISEDPTSIDDLGLPVDSLTAVEVLIVLDAILGKEIPNTVIQAGGYSSEAEFVDKLTKSVLDFASKS